jgi:hypothetical protein
MHITHSWMTSTSIVILSLGAIACESRSDDNNVASLLGPSSAGLVTVTVEPAAIIPEVAPSSFCGAYPSFRGRFRLTVRAGLGGALISSHF